MHDEADVFVDEACIRVSCLFPAVVKNEVIAAEAETARLEEEKDQIIAAMAARQELKEQQQALNQQEAQAGQQQQQQQQQQHDVLAESEAAVASTSTSRVDVYESKDPPAPVESGEWHVNTRPGKPNKNKIGADPPHIAPHHTLSNHLSE